MVAKKDTIEYRDKNGISLKEFVMSYIDTCRDLHLNRLTSLEEKIVLNLKLNELALEKAEQKLEERLKGMNQFREDLREQAMTFVTHKDLDTVTEKVNIDIRYLREYAARLNGKASAMSVIGAYTLAVISILVSIVLALYAH